MSKVAILCVKVLLPLLVLAGVVAALGTTGRCRVCASIVDAVLGRTAASAAMPDDRRELESSGDAVEPVERGPIHRLVLQDLDGREVDLARFAGRPMVIEIWATWCRPCVTLRRTLAQIAPQLAEHAALVAVSVDEQGPAAVRRHLARELGSSDHAASSPFVELMVSPAFRAAIAPHDSRPTIPKLVYVDSRGRVAGIESGLPDGAWILARARSLQ